MKNFFSVIVTTFSILITACSDTTNTTVALGVDDDLHSLEITWQPATHNVDGDELGTIEGYIIKWGQVSGSYPNSLIISDTSPATTSIGNLAAGDYFFVMQTLMPSGLISDYSNEMHYSIIE